MKLPEERWVEAPVQASIHPDALAEMVTSMVEVHDRQFGQADRIKLALSADLVAALGRDLPAFATNIGSVVLVEQEAAPVLFDSVSVMVLRFIPEHSEVPS